MPGGLTRLEQADFSAGMFRWPRHRIPAKGVYDATDAILTDDGSLVERGGSVYKANASLATSIDRLWDGFLSPAGARRTVFGHATTIIGDPAYVLSILDPTDDATPVTVWTWFQSVGPLPGELTHAITEAGGFLFVGARNVYGGRAPISTYSTGTVDLVPGSKTAVGHGTTWGGGAVTPGTVLTATGASGQLGLVKSVTDNTHLELAHPWPAGALTGVSYSLSSGAFVVDYPQLTAVGAAGNEYVAAIGSPARLVVAKGDIVAFSARGEPFKADLDDYHRIPGGEWVTGLGAPTRDTLIVFTTGGVWAISNMNLDLTDPFGNPQQRLQRISNAIKWQKDGVVPWKSGVIACCTDDVWYFDGASEPTKLSEPITPLYRSYVAAGHHVGVATIYQGHLLLPIVTSGNVAADMLVCRLDTGAWTRWAGDAGRTRVVARRTGAPSGQPLLLTGGPTTSPRLRDASGAFAPAAAVKADADGTTPQFDVVTRDMELGSNNPHNQVKQIRVTYELADAASDNPTLLGYVASDAPGASFTQLTSPQAAAPESDGGAPWTWTANKSGRRARVRVKKGAQPTSGLALRRVEVFVRQAGKQV